MIAEWPRGVIPDVSQSPVDDPEDWLIHLEELAQVGLDRPLDELFSVIVDTTMMAVGADGCSLGIWEPESGEVVIRVHTVRRRPTPGARFAPGVGIAGWVASTRRPAVIADVTRDPRYATIDYPRTSSAASVPLLWDEDFLGTLTVTSVRRDAFDDQSLRVLRLFATQASALIIGAQRIAVEGARAACLELAVDAVEEGVVVCDADLRFVSVNQTAAAALGLHVDAGTPADAWPRSLDAVRQAVERAVREGEATPAVPLPGPGGGAGASTARVTPLLAPDGQPIGAVVVLQGGPGGAAQGSADSGAFADLAHDLRSPLGSLRGILSLVLQDIDRPLGEAQRDLLRSAQIAADRLHTTVERLVGQSTRDLEEQPALQPVALSEIVNAVINRIQGYAASKNVTLESAVSERLPRVQADPFQLARLVENLLDNAVKFSRPDGRVRVEAEVVDDRIECSVRDTGVGIPAWALERIFERGYRTPTARATHEGSGLGLDICRRIVEQHGGTIWAESVEGEGATFHFNLPVAR